MANELTRQLLDDELMHYGVMGMHWGVRRYQPYGKGGYDPEGKAGTFVGKVKQTRKGYQKSLNKLQKQSERFAAVAKERDRLQRKYTDKSNRLNEKGRKRASLKYANKALKERALRDKYEQRVKDIDSETWKIVGDAMGKKFDITDSYTKRMVDGGNKAAQALLVMFVSPMAIGLAMKPHSVESHRFKVTKQRGEKPEFTTKANVQGLMRMNDWEQRAKKTGYQY